MKTLITLILLLFSTLTFSQDFEFGDKSEKIIAVEQDFYIKTDTTANGIIQYHFQEYDVDYTYTRIYLFKKDRLIENDIEIRRSNSQKKSYENAIKDLEDRIKYYQEMGFYINRDTYKNEFDQELITISIMTDIAHINIVLKNESDGYYVSENQSGGGYTKNKTKKIKKGRS
jgi:hypothetical protein